MKTYEEPKINCIRLVSDRVLSGSGTGTGMDTEIEDE